MKEVMAIIRMNKMNQTKQALADAGVASFTARKVMGRGKGKVDYLLMKGAEAGCEEAIVQLGPGPKLIPKRLLNVVVPDDLVPVGRADDHRGEPDGQPRRRQDLRHAGVGRLPRADRRARRRGPGRNAVRGAARNAMSTESTIDAAAEVRQDLLKIYPPKVARKRSQQIVVNEQGRRAGRPRDPRQRAHHAGDHHAARLHLCRLQGRGARADPRHRQHHPRPDRLRLLLLAHAAEPDPPAHRRGRQLHDLLLLDRHAGGGDHLRRREEAPRGDPGGLRPVPSQGDRRVLHLPGRPDRRRRPRRHRGR